MKGDLLKNQLGPRDEKLSSKHQVFRISYHISDSLERSWSSTSIIWYVCWSWSSSSASGVSETFDIPTAVLKSVPSNHTLERYWYALNYPTYIHKYIYIYLELYPICCIGTSSTFIHKVHKHQFHQSLQSFLGTSRFYLTISPSGPLRKSVWKSLVSFSCPKTKTNPFEKYARQIGSFPQGSGWTWKIFKKPPGYYIPHKTWIISIPYIP